MSDKENIPEEESPLPKKRRQVEHHFLFKEKTLSAANMKTDGNQVEETQKLQNLVIQKLDVLTTSGEILKSHKLPYSSPTHPMVFKKLFGSELNKRLTIIMLNDLLTCNESEKIMDLDEDKSLNLSEITLDSNGVLVFNCVRKNNTSVRIIFICSPDPLFQEKIKNLQNQVYDVICLALVDYYTVDETDGWIKRYGSAGEVKFVVLELLSFSIGEIFKSDSIYNKWGFFLKMGDILTSSDLKEQGLWSMPLGQAFNALRQLKWSLPELALYEQIEALKLQCLNEHIALEEKIIAEERVKIAMEQIASGKDFALVLLTTGLSAKLLNNLMQN